MKKTLFSKSQRVYIIPTRLGAIYAIGCFGLLFAASSYDNNLIYLLFFILTVAGLLAMHQTNENLKNLKIKDVHISLAPSDQQGVAHVFLKNESADPKHSIDIYADKREFGSATSISNQGLVKVLVPLSARARGVYSIERLKISTLFPLGLFYSWSYQKIDRKFYVYPKPQGQTSIHPSYQQDHWGRAFTGPNGQDFKEHKSHQVSDGYRKIDWKAYAKHRQLLSKHYEGESTITYFLDFNSLIDLDIEKRLAQLSLWAEHLEAQGFTYGLTLPELKIPPSSGPQHLKSCLVALAQFKEQTNV